MTKPGDLLTKKTIHELSKEFPEKTYRQLEIYRDADRQEEAQRIITQQENEELKENQLTESERRQMELEPIEKEIRKREELEPIEREIRWREKFNKEHKLRQEADGELSILKGIETNRVKEYIKKNDELQNELDRTKKENNDLYNKVAKLKEAELAAHGIQKARESGL